MCSWHAVLSYLAFHAWSWLSCGFSKVLFNSLMTTVVPGKWQSMTKREIYAHGGVTLAIAWMSTSVTAFKWAVLLTALFSYLLSCKHTVVFSLLQGTSDLKSSVQVQEGIFSMARVLLKLEVLLVDQHIPLLWAGFSWNAEDLFMVSTIAINKIGNRRIWK